MVRLSSRIFQGTRSAGLGAGAAPIRIISSSAVFKDLCWPGSSRYQNQHTAHQMSPTTPNIANAPRQPNQPINATAIGGAKAPPDLAPIHITPLARPRSWTGNQRASEGDSVGNATA